jgi:GTP-binding protein EngB required for normal cell division
MAMITYQCELCGRYYTEPWCSQDQRELTREVDPATLGADEVVAAIERNAADLAAAVPAVAPPEVTELETPLPPRPARVRPQRIAEPVADAAPEPAAAQQRPQIAGLPEFQSLLQQGLQAVVICGLPNTGKSQIVNAFTKANTIYRGRAQFAMQRATLRTEDALGATVKQEVWYQVADDRHVFLDPSGEFFRALSLEERQRQRLPDVTDEYFDFVRDALKQLAGIVLVIDLFGGGQQLDRSGWSAQENDFTFILPALRWLRFDKEARPPGVGVSINIAARVQKLPQLDVPVLVLFSKADRLEELTNQEPLAFARRNLPTLHGALITHARRFRFDFCHTMTRRGDGDREVDRPCGVLLSMEWLLDRRLRWLPRVPTTWLGGGKR